MIFCSNVGRTASSSRISSYTAPQSNSALALLKKNLMESETEMKTEARTHALTCERVSPERPSARQQRFKAAEGHGGVALDARPVRDHVSAVRIHHCDAPARDNNSEPAVKVHQQ